MHGVVNQPAAFINAMATAVPGHDIHNAFIGWAEGRIGEPRQRALFRKMVERAGIGHRWSILPPTPTGGSPVDPGGFYAGTWPTTAQRMHLYAREAPRLALAAIDKLGAHAAPAGVTHLVVASCTGFVAPGIDQIIAAELGLDPGVERTLVGFMGCYAAVAALRLAHHIVRSERDARVLVVAVELSSLHLQLADEIEPLLAMLQFGDGAAAALVTARPQGFGISRLFSTTFADTDDLIRWTIGDAGFAMHLSGRVPGAIGHALASGAMRKHLLGGKMPDTINAWAIHAGGRSILDAVQQALGLDRNALKESRNILANFGNMSSATLMFVLADLLRDPRHTNGIALAFGPGLAAEGFCFGRPA